MGWLFGHGQTRSQLIERLTRDEEHNGTTRHCLRHYASGNVLWTVWEIHRPTDPPFRYIGCDLMAYDRSCAGWGYKDLCEEMEPLYYSCPLAYLDMVPPASAAWREQVRTWHAARSRVLTIGDTLTFSGLSITQAVVVGKRRRTWVVECNGHRYALPPRMLRHIVEQVPGTGPQHPASG
ncbi:hypothetical protein [Paraburkholderia sp. BL21I4N1]|uniref:hypothetical protein n=1 Tax=Paraburkholderia sp. BL21I4N1 TaxID=1938801 RepID=UPI000CFE2E71|nr:hypothetical protein [Paraburkholderia sp. BL21I4N1]PQV44117.1 hypothetical protein B0G83_12715 [Paraburkholderia sp. BL21I4N1]